MLKIKTKHTSRLRSGGLTFVAIVLLGSGAYVLSLVAAPTIAPMVAMKPINVNNLPAPTATDNRIVIPKIGVNIVYGEGEAALNRGAQWRFPDRGNPATGGNFIIAAHRFTIAPTPGETVAKSPFYNIDKLIAGDKIVVDYSGIRYGYEITKKFDVKPTQVEIEAPSEESKLTLYSCELGGSDAGRVVITAKPLGRVQLVKN
jgi:sortase A